MIRSTIIAKNAQLLRTNAQFGTKLTKIIRKTITQYGNLQAVTQRLK